MRRDEKRREEERRDEKITDEKRREEKRREEKRRESFASLLSMILKFKFFSVKLISYHRR